MLSKLYRLNASLPYWASMTLPANIRLGWKGFFGQTLEHILSVRKKSNNIGPSGFRILWNKSFYVLITLLENKLECLWMSDSFRAGAFSLSGFFIKRVGPEKSYSRERFRTADFLLLTSLYQLLFLMKIIFIFFTKRATLISWSIVLSLPFQLVFPGWFQALFAIIEPERKRQTVRNTLAYYIV